MNDYILESMDITDVSIDDIEYEKQLAEINVIEAMINCYEKQLMLMEYNEESACEIMMESGIIMEASDDKRPLSIKAKAAFNRMISALKTLVLSIIDQIRAANFSKLGKMINNMEGAGIKIKVSSTEFKNKDSVFFIINANSMNDKWNKIGDDFDFLQDNSIRASLVSAPESIKKELIDKCDEIIKVSNHFFDDGENIDSDVKIFNKDQLITMCLICSGHNMKALRSFAHQIEKWNSEYSKYGYDRFDSNVMSKLREAVKALIKALTRYSKALIPIVKVIRNVIKKKDPDKFKEYDIENNETTKPNTTDEKADSTESDTTDENADSTESKTSDESKSELFDEIKNLTNSQNSFAKHTSNEFFLNEFIKDISDHKLHEIRFDISVLAREDKNLSTVGKVIDTLLEYAFSHGIKEDELYHDLNKERSAELLSVEQEDWNRQYFGKLLEKLRYGFTKEYIAHVKKVAKYLSENN